MTTKKGISPHQCQYKRRAHSSHLFLFEVSAALYKREKAPPPCPLLRGRAFLHLKESALSGDRYSEMKDKNKERERKCIDCGEKVRDLKTITRNLN